MTKHLLVFFLVPLVSLPLKKKTVILEQNNCLSWSVLFGFYFFLFLSLSLSWLRIIVPIRLQRPFKDWLPMFECSNFGCCVF